MPSGGGAKGGPETPANPALDQQAYIANQLFQETSGLRSGVISELSNLLGFAPPPPTAPQGYLTQDQANAAIANIQAMPLGDSPAGDPRPDLISQVQARIWTPPETSQTATPGQSPLFSSIFAPARESLEAQFQNAEENILSSTPVRGGQLNDALVNAQLARAGSVGGLQANILQNAFAQALGVGFGAPPTAIQGLGSAAALTQNANQFAAQQQAQQSQMLGGALGTGIGFALGGPVGAGVGGKAGSSSGGAK